MVKKKSIEAYLIDDFGCWVWRRTKTSRGYGFTYAGGKQILAHRYYYELHKGSIPDGLVIDHLCGNTSCVNPEHLEAVTIGINSHRGFVRRERYAHMVAQEMNKREQQRAKLGICPTCGK